ncbi:hypothetical protein OAB44_00010 [Pelagibacteraceae bacterium]|nr:hypothetical protein [Pelagibacteraceae bacterium]
MKKFLYSTLILFIFVLFGAIFYLSSIGFETSKFNNLIIKEIKKKDSEVELKLEKIKIKLDLKKIQLFLSTNNPNIIYRNTKIPITEIKIYSKISKIVKSKIEVNQIIFEIEKFKIQDLQKIAIRIKPSNFKTYLLNNIEGGEIEKALFDINTNKDFMLIDYKVNGTINKTNLRIKKNLKIQDVGFNFILDKNLALINSIKATYDGILVSNGSINFQQKKEIEIKGKFNTKLVFNEKKLNKLFTKVNFFKKNKIKLNGSLIHEFNLKINKNFKITDYVYKSSGNILQSRIILENIFKKNFIEKPVEKILFQDTKVVINFNKKNKNLLLEGLYSTNESTYKKFTLRNKLIKNKQNYYVDFNLSNNLVLDFINFRTDIRKISNVKSEFSIKNNILKFKSIDFMEDKNSILIKGLSLNNKNEIKNLSSVKVLTFNKEKVNNNFTINFGKKISITGEKYDSTNLIKLLTNDNKFNILKNFNKEVQIQLKNLITKSNIPLSNFNLIGLIENGKFSKLSTKSEFSDNKYLDISLKKDPNNKKILEVYSDFPQALLADFSFFEGIRDGKLLYNSIIDKSGSASKLVIEDFKVTTAPTFATLLTLADLSGFADLLSGGGMSFDILEVNMKDENNVITVDEILALGSSVSLRMEGYIEKTTGLVSLSGTLVPAKTLNILVSKIPVVGNILVGEKVGEGVFGVSFKIKGLPGKIKTSVNPVKTITPRFITRALEKLKNK